jgi:hypothetical protein
MCRSGGTRNGRDGDGDTSGDTSVCILACLAPAQVAAWYVSDWLCFEEFVMSCTNVTNIRISRYFIVSFLLQYLTSVSSEIVVCISCCIFGNFHLVFDTAVAKVTVTFLHSFLFLRFTYLNYSFPTTSFRIINQTCHKSIIYNHHPTFLTSFPCNSTRRIILYT